MELKQATEIQTYEAMQHMGAYNPYVVVFLFCFVLNVRSISSEVILWLWPIQI